MANSASPAAETEMRKVCEYFGVDWEREHSVTSVGGLVMAELERIPDAGETVEWKGLAIEVLEATETGPEKLRVSRSATPEPAEPE